MSARTRFVQLAVEQIGKPSLWGAQGPKAFDCSGLVMASLLGVGAKLSDHTAQMFSDETPALASYAGAAPIPGDLGFYGADDANIIHVVIWLAGGKVLSADGATARVVDLKTAQANPSARIRIHDATGYRKNFRGIHRNKFVDFLDRVTR